MLWQKQFDVEPREKSILLIDNYLDRQITWYYGQEIRIGGKKANIFNIDEVEKINTQCLGPYIIVNNF
jgi:hypothetical protein